MHQEIIQRRWVLIGVLSLRSPSTITRDHRSAVQIPGPHRRSPNDICLTDGSRAPIEDAANGHRSKYRRGARASSNSLLLRASRDGHPLTRSVPLPLTGEDAQ